MQIYLVGGAVRDQLLNHPYHERDWVVVGATPEQLLDLGYQQVGKDFPVFLHPNTREEYALARTEKKSGRGYCGFICDFGPEVSLEEDLQRRDLTINAMAKTDDGEIIDPYGGQSDLQNRVLRHVSPAFSEDPLRVLRVARFAARYAQLGFTLADQTLELMKTMSQAGELGTITAERIWVEIGKGLSTHSPAVFLQTLLDCDALSALFPSWAQSLDEKIFIALAKAADVKASTDIRFAIACSGLKLADCQQLCDQIKASNAARDLATLACSLVPLDCAMNAEALLKLLEKLDYLRRPERLANFVTLATLLGDPHPALGLLAEAASQLSGIKAEALIEQGYQGAALGKALRRERLSGLEKLLSRR